MQKIFKLFLRSEFSRASRICKGATALVGISNSYLDWALKHAGRSANKYDCVFPLGYEKPSSINGLKGKDHSDKLRVVFAGGFGVSYDLETVIECARLIYSQNCESVHIVLAGGGEKEVKLKRLASNLPNIEFAGKLNYNQVLDLYVKSDVGLCAYSKDATQSLPNKPFEYMASSLALLSSLPGELEEIIRKEKIGLQYKADDPKSLAEQLCYLMKNRDECEAMGERAKNLFDSCYSSDIIYPRLIGFLDTVVQENLRKR